MLAKYRIYLVAVLFVGFLCHATGGDVNKKSIKWTRQDGSNYLKALSRFYELPYDILYAWVWAESHWRPWTREWVDGKCISYGLTQTSQATDREYHTSRGEVTPSKSLHLMDPRHSLEIGTWNIHRHYRRYRDKQPPAVALKMALSAHNLGERGLRDFTARTGARWYGPYIRRVEFFLKREIK